MKKILVCVKEQITKQLFKDRLKADYYLQFSNDLSECLFRLKETRHELLFIDFTMINPDPAPSDNFDYLKIFQEFTKVSPSIQIIVISKKSQVKGLVKLVKSGASDYLTYPLDPDEIELAVNCVRKDIRIQSELEYLRDEFWRQETLKYVQTKNPTTKKVFEKVKSVAQTKATVLLLGETGTGKSVLAKLIHMHSRRGDKQFIQVCCGAMQETLVESELFGHEKGSFTGAIKKKLGKFEIANGGTIFLDEIGTLTKPIQIKLLEVLQDKTFHRIGGEVPVEVDVRVIAATNDDLGQLMNDGTFRKDLYYRLNVFPIDVPPLRERKEDIPDLFYNFLNELNKEYGKDIQKVDPAAIDALKSYDWPGNIREMENIAERAYILEQSDTLAAKNFPKEVMASISGKAHMPVNTSLTIQKIRKQAIEHVEKQYLRELLSEHNGRIKATASAAGISTRQIHKLLTKYGLQKSDFKVK